MITFSNILVPVDYTINTEVAIKKALELCEPDATIHLFHIHPFNAFHLSPVEAYLMVPQQQIDNEMDLKRFKPWKRMIKKHAPGVQVRVEIKFQESKIESAIIDKAKELKPDIIILGKQSCHSWLPFLNTIVPSHIAAQTQCAVLTVKPGASDSSIKKIIVPIGDFVPRKKIELLQSLSQKCNMQVYLLSIISSEKEEQDFSVATLAETLRIVKKLLRCPVQFHVMRNTNKVKAVLHYATLIDADMIVVHPETETRIDGLTGKYLSDIILPQSHLHVLAVNPSVQ